MSAKFHSDTRSVRFADLCRLAVHRPQGSEPPVFLSVIGSLVTGVAAGLCRT